jgi:nitrous oxidase accessory protein NosD
LNVEEEHFMKMHFIILILVWAGSAQAATLTVCPSGCDYSDIQAAVDVAHPGEELRIISGTFDRVVLDKQLIFRVGPLGSFTNMNDFPSIGTVYKCGYNFTWTGMWTRLDKEIDECVSPPCKKCHQNESSGAVNSSLGATFIVCQSGCKYRSIQEAIDAANPGDVVEVHSGTYYETPVFNNCVSLVGNDTGEGKPILMGNINGNGCPIYVHNITISGGQSYELGQFWK